MADIYLQHPRHGEKVACTEQEAKADRENGWKDYTPSTVAPAATGLPAFLGGTGEAVESDLPDDFPGRQALIEGGFPTWASVVGKTEAELVALKGIGAATAKQIIAKLDS